MERTKYVWVMAVELNYLNRLVFFVPPPPSLTFMNEMFHDFEIVGEKSCTKIEEIKKNSLPFYADCSNAKPLSMESILFENIPMKTTCHKLYGKRMWRVKNHEINLVWLVGCAVSILVAVSKKMSLFGHERPLLAINRDQEKKTLKKTEQRPHWHSTYHTFLNKKSVWIWSHKKCNETLPLL